MVWQRLTRKLRRRKSGHASSTDVKRRRALRLETLDKRELLASDVGAITGTVFDDINGNGIYDSGIDQVVANATVRLFQDFNDDGIPDDTNDDGVIDDSDALQTEIVTPADNGVYRFEDICSGVYLVQQAALPGSDITPSPIRVSVGTVIDRFDQPVGANQQSVLATAVNTSDDSSVGIDEEGSIGGERDIRVVLNSGNFITAAIDPDGDILDPEEFLSFGSMAADGGFLLQFDGPDNTLDLDPTGLGGVSLADGVPGDPLDPDAGIYMDMQSDLAGNTMTATVHTDGSNSATFVVNIVPGRQDYFLDFRNPTSEIGTVDFNNVGAIEFSFAIASEVDSRIFAIEAVQTDEAVVDLPNRSMRLGGVVFLDTGAGANSNSGFFDADESGADGVLVELYNDPDNDGMIDPSNQTAIDAMSTDGSGNYLFDGLDPGNYLVVIPEPELGPGEVLDGLVSSTGIDPPPDPNDNVLDDDNGFFVAGVGIQTGIITLVLDDEPVDDGDDDPNTNLTLGIGVTSESDLSITKTDNITVPAIAGDQLTYTIVITNNGPAIAQGVVATDTLPSDVTFISGAFDTTGGLGNGTVVETAPGSGILTITPDDEMASGASVQIDVVVEIAADAADSIQNSVTVTPNPDTDNNDTNDTATETTPVVRNVDVGVDKSSTGDAIAGLPLTYVIEVTNNGPGEARDVEVTDTLDAAFTFDSFDPGTSGVTIATSGQDLTFDVGTLADGETQTFSFIVDIASSATGTISNTADITTTDNDTNAANDSDTVDVDVMQTIDLVLTKSVDLATAVPGQDTLEYSFVISHDTGSVSDAGEIVFTDVLPDGLTGATIDAPPEATTDFDSTTGTVTVTFDSLAAGSTHQFSFTTLIDEDATGDVVNTGSMTVVGDDDSSNNTDDATTSLTPEFDVTISKNVDDNTPVPGTDVTYTIDVANSGPSTATGVIVTDDIPDGLTFVSGDLNGQSPTVSGDTVTFAAITLSDDQAEQATLVFTVDIDSAGTITNTAEVTADPGETDTTNNTDTAEITATPLADLTVTKAVDQANASPGDALQYTITVTNSGVSTAVDSVAVDTLPMGVTFVDGTGPNDEALSEVDGVVTVDGGDLAPDASFEFIVNVTVDEGSTGTLTNTVDVSTATAESDDTNNTDTAQTEIDPLLSTISGFVYLDANNDGIKDPGEEGIEGVTIILTGMDVLGNTIDQVFETDADGQYLFEQLAEGTYEVMEIQPARYRNGQTTAGTGATATVGDDIFTNLALGADTDAIDFNFGELSERLSKRRFLASSE